RRRLRARIQRDSPRGLERSDQGLDRHPPAKVGTDEPCGHTAVGSLGRGAPAPAPLLAKQAQSTDRVRIKPVAQCVIHVAASSKRLGQSGSGFGGHGTPCLTPRSRQSLPSGMVTLSPPSAGRACTLPNNGTRL